jgi:hypothetical protein
LQSISQFLSYKMGRYDSGEASLFQAWRWEIGLSAGVRFGFIQGEIYHYVIFTLPRIREKIHIMSATK